MRFRATVTLVLLYLVLLGDMFSLHQIPTLRSVNDITEDSTQEAHVCFLKKLPVWCVTDSMLLGNDVCFLGATFYLGAISST